MVSIYPQLPQECASFCGYSSSDRSVMNIPAGMDEALTADDSKVKVRKPYTITKSRESWTEQEHDKFFEALHLFDRDWKKIEAFVGSKNVIQIRSHAQKYFLKVTKNGASERVPPPRPKRKASHPYPQKARKSDASLDSTRHLDAYSIPRNSGSTVTRSGPSPITTNDGAVSGTSYWASSSSSSNNNNNNNGVSSSQWMMPGEETPQKSEVRRTHNTGVMPDFAQVYSFIGSVMDPCDETGGHLQKLRSMDPINFETVLMLMENLAINLSSPEFEDETRSSIGVK